jgi:hypothetical protein
MNGFSISFFDRLRSIWNRFAFQLRNLIAFRRSGYVETGTSAEQLEKWVKSLPAPAQQLVLEIEKKYHLDNFRAHLHLDNYRKNLATLWILEQLLGNVALPKGIVLKVLEAGCQDFSRLPSLSQYLFTRGHASQIAGVELDAYRILHNFHSRADLANHYSQYVPGSQYRSGDIFQIDEQYDLFLAFYPFVSPHPALAWGLPMEFGSAKRWVEGLMRNVKPEGYALVVQQGSWEEQEFDTAMPFGAFRLQLVERKIVDCPFYPLPHPAHGSVYQLVLS